MKKCEREVLIDQIETRVCQRMENHWIHLMDELRNFLESEKKHFYDYEPDWCRELLSRDEYDQWKEVEDRIQSYYDEFEKIAPNGDI